jgi:hypothetical protein
MNHNKKRNTAFLFEILVQEQTKCVLKKEDKKALLIEKIIKKFFSENSYLYKELELYNLLSESKFDNNQEANNFLFLIKEEKRSLSEEKIFEEQSKLISIINKNLGPDLFENFVPKYKIYATINILLNKNSSLKEKMIMENSIKQYLLSANVENKEYIKEDVNMLVFKKTMENFNNEYKELLPEQKTLLNKFLLHKFGEKIDFKLYLNEECKRIHDNLVENIKKVENNKELYEKLNIAVSNLKNNSVKYFDDVFIYSLLNYQKLSRELNNG